VPNKKKIPRLNAGLLIINIFSFLGFIFVLFAVSRVDFAGRMDAWLNSTIHSVYRPVLNDVMVFITNIVSPVQLMVLSSILIAILVYERKKYLAALFIAGMLGGFASEFLIKAFIERARPENSLISAGGYSFPSGHATMSIIFFSLVLYSFKDDIRKSVNRYIFAAVNIILLLVVGLSRVYLNVHWLSDVLAGFLLGLFWVSAVILIYDWTADNKNKKRKIS